MYRVAHLLANLVWVDIDFGCPTILPTCSANSANCPSAQAELGRGWNSTNQSQLHHVFGQKVTPPLTVNLHFIKLVPSASGICCNKLIVPDHDVLVGNAIDN